MNFNSEKLIDLRWSKRLKQKELAALIGAQSAVVSTWESGKHVPTTKYLLRLADVFSVEPCYFFD